MWQVLMLVGVFCGVFQWGTSLAHALPEEIANGTAVIEEIEAIEASGREAPAPLDDPNRIIRWLKTGIDMIDPSYELVLDFWNGDQYQGLSGALKKFHSHKIEVASWRLGASTGLAVYTGLGLDLGGIGRRYVPKVVKRITTVGPLDEVWSFIGKYGRVSAVGGWSFDHDDPVVATTFGASGNF